MSIENESQMDLKLPWYSLSFASEPNNNNNTVQQRAVLQRLVLQVLLQDI